MRSHTRQRWFYLLGLLTTLVICISAPVGAAQVLPHIFYGNVTINSQPAPVGTHITASVAGGGEDYITSVSGQYGTGWLVELFNVQPAGEDGMIADDAPITFYINGVQAEVYEVGKGPWMASYPFQDGGDTNLNLRLGASGDQYTITSSAGSGGTINPAGSIQVAKGASQTFIITPDSCHTILDVKVDGVSVGAKTSHTINNVTANHSIQATFAAKTVYANSSAGAGGTISPLGNQTVQCGGSITYTITPTTGYRIQDVVVNGISRGPGSTLTISPVTMNQIVVASFTSVPAINFTINATAGPNGTITPAGNVTVMYGAVQSFTMVPASGYTINQILVDGNPVNRTPVYTFSNVDANHTIAVTFMKGAPEYFAVELDDGWNLFSTPIKLASGHQYIENIFPPDSLAHIEVVLGWNGTTWFVPGYGYELKPLSALYVKVQDSAMAFVYPSQAVSSPPSRSMAEGWNLIGPAPDFKNGGFSAKSVEASLITVYGNSTTPGYLIAVSPGLNQPGWSYVRDGPAEDMLPYKGYWVYMDNPKTLAGFSTTPIS